MSEDARAPSAKSGRPLTFRAYRDGEHRRASWRDATFNEDRSHKCPAYVHRTPPCQAGCPSG
ncbi:MAG: hypothetical protein OD817_07865, partial [Gammaproteobacteria bacterium]